MNVLACLPFDICSVMIDWRTSVNITRTAARCIVYHSYSYSSGLFWAGYLLDILCLVAIPTEVSASSHLLNGWQCFITLTQVVSPSVIKTLKIGTTDLQMRDRHSLCTDILYRWLILCSVWYFDARDSAVVLCNVDELTQYLQCLCQQDAHCL